MKKMLAAALAASMVMGLTACGGSQTADTKAPESAKEADSTATGESTETAGSDAQKTGSEMTWKLATDAAKDYPTTKALVKFADGLNDYSIQGIGFTDNGSRCFYTTTEVDSLDDFKGLAIRVQNNQLMNSMVSCLGGNPVNVSANEVYSALQTGVCKGGENNPNIILSDSLYEVAPYVLMDNHVTTMDVICMNLDLWDSLSDEDKEIVNEAMADATAYDREIWDDSVAESIQTLKDKGATIVEPDDATLDSFREAMAPVYEEYSAKYGDLLDAINEALGK